MREAHFIQKNRLKWQDYDKKLTEKSLSVGPEELMRMFTEVNEDLAYAQTYYQGSGVEAYLNQLALQLHRLIYSSQREEKSRYLRFWTHELPLVFLKCHRQMAYAFAIFAAAVLIGVISSQYDEGFPRLILGSNYVNMTIENIRNDDPMAVYKSSGRMSSFAYIAVNNLMVAFRTFVFGLFFSVGAVFILMYNGIMVGAFQSLFYRYDLLFESALVIWIHGTVEISCIIVAGGAGIVLGNSILFPKNLPRLYSLRQGALQGLKLMVGLMPLIVFAAFLEGFVTRLTDIPTAGKASIILVQLAFVVYYFIVFPLMLKKKGLSA